MESVTETRPSEWDRRLSTNSPFRTVSINGQRQSAVSLTNTGNTLQQYDLFIFFGKHDGIHSQNLSLDSLQVAQKLGDISMPSVSSATMQGEQIGLICASHSEMNLN